MNSDNSHRFPRAAPYLARLKLLGSRHGHLFLILVVFLTFRLAVPFVFRSGSYFVEQAPDIDDYLRWGTLSDSGLYPYVHYWSEYPPLFAWSMLGLYRISTLLPAWPFDQRLWFAIVLQLAMILFDTGSLILVYAIARRLGGRARAVRTAALFAGAFIMAYAASSWYEPAPLFFMLLGLYLALRDRFTSSAVVIGIGTMMKIFPVLVVPMALRRVTRLRQAVGYLAALAATIAAILLPFLLTRPDLVAAFAASTLNRPTWLSIWALFDGSYAYGVAVPVINRFTTTDLGATYVTQLPWPVIHLAFLGAFLYLFTRKVDWRSPKIGLSFTGLTVILFLLWSKGFSGQFIVYAFPFILLLMPNLRGVLYAALLSAIWVAEWPIAFQMMEGQNWFIVWLILARSLALIALCLEYGSEFFAASRSPRGARWVGRAPRLAGTLLALTWISLLPVGALAVHGYTQARLADDRAAPALSVIRADGEDARVIAFAQPRLFRRLYPGARGLGEVTLLPIFKHTPEAARLAWLSELAARGPFWFIADEGDPETLDENRQAEVWLSDHACKVDTQVAGSARLSRFVATDSFPVQMNADAAFEDEIDLTGVGLSRAALRPGDGLCVELNWRAAAAPSANYTMFVHLIDSQGRLVAQSDLQPRGDFAPTSAWQPGATIADKHGLILPENLSPGDYTVRVGMYHSADGSPVGITRGEPAASDSNAVAVATVRVEP